MLYGGSESAAGALRLALEINRISKTPLQVFSQGVRSECESQLLSQDFSEAQIKSLDWQIFNGGRYRFINCTYFA